MRISVLAQCPLNFNVHLNLQRVLLKCKFQFSRPRSCLRVCISKKLPSGANDAEPGSTLSSKSLENYLIQIVTTFLSPPYLGVFVVDIGWDHDLVSNIFSN